MIVGGIKFILLTSIPLIKYRAQGSMLELEFFFTLQIAQKMAKSRQNQWVVTFGVVLVAISWPGFVSVFASAFHRLLSLGVCIRRTEKCNGNFLAGAFRGAAQAFKCGADIPGFWWLPAASFGTRDWKVP